MCAVARLYCRVLTDKVVKMAVKSAELDLDEVDQNAHDADTNAHDGSDGHSADKDDDSKQFHQSSSGQSDNIVDDNGNGDDTDLDQDVDMADTTGDATNPSKEDNVHARSKEHTGQVCIEASDAMTDSRKRFLCKEMLSLETTDWTTFIESNKQRLQQRLEATDFKELDIRAVPQFFSQLIEKNQYGHVIKFREDFLEVVLCIITDKGRLLIHNNVALQWLCMLLTGLQDLPDVDE